MDDLILRIYRSRRPVEWGVIVGGLALFGCCLSNQYFIRMPEFRARQRTNEVRMHHRQIAKALVNYRAAHGAFPPAIAMADQVQDARELANAKGSNLTTCDPRFLPAQPKEVCSSDSSRPYAYYTDGEKWVLLSPGPDWKYDVQNLAELLKAPAAHIIYPYDPTNGTFSSGDIWRFGEEDEVQP